MKKQILFVLILLYNLNSNKVCAQIDASEKQDSLIQLKYFLNCMVPDIPAFNALDENPSNMLKPSSPRDLALMFSSFRNGDRFIIPRSFAAEFAPALLLSTRIKLHDYQTNYWVRMLTKSRLSLATSSENNKNLNRLAAGIKLTLIDHGDYRNDTTFLKERIYKLTDAYESYIHAKIEAYKKANNLTQIQFAAIEQEFEDTLLLSLIRLDIQHSVEEYQRNHWNSNRMEMTYSIVSSSSDSVLNTAKLDKHLFWLVYAIKPGKDCDWAQIMFGLNEQFRPSFGNNFYNQFSLNARAYIGSNKAKGFAEAQYKNSRWGKSNTHQNSLFLNLGLDINVYSGIWVHLAGGINNIIGQSARSELNGTMKIYLSLPENLKFF